MADTTTEQRLVTADELWAMPDDGVRRELVRGEVVTMAPAGAEHGQCEDELYFALSTVARRSRLGRMYPADTGFVLSRDPDTVREADGAFVRADRLPADRHKGFVEGAPDLAVEVVSPTDREPAVLAKAAEWVEAGTTVVLIVWPDSRLVTVYRAGGAITSLTVDDTLTVPDLLPGFSLPVAEIFA